MRKLMLLAAMLAMVLVAAAPAFAQVAIAGDIDSDGFDHGFHDDFFDDDNDFFDDGLNDSFNTDEVFVDITITQTADADQVGGDAIASGDGSAAAVDNSLFINQSVNSGGFGFLDNDLDDDGILDHMDHVIFVW